MSIREFANFSVNFADLATWRKLCFLFALGVFCSVGTIATLKECNIYAAAPTMPSIATGQTYAVHVMHGSLRYVTQGEAASLIFWREEIGPFIGIPFIVAFLVVATSRK